MTVKIAADKRRSLILLSASSPANRANADRNSRDISTNTRSDREDLPITLNEFLQECNRSPKSRVRCWRYAIRNVNDNQNECLEIQDDGLVMTLVVWDREVARRKCQRSFGFGGLQLILGIFICIFRLLGEQERIEFGGMGHRKVPLKYSHGLR